MRLQLGSELESQLLEGALGASVRGHARDCFHGANGVPDDTDAALSFSKNHSLGDRDQKFDDAKKV
jgi:hypothetical protein